MCTRPAVHSILRDRRLIQQKEPSKRQHFLTLNKPTYNNGIKRKVKRRGMKRDDDDDLSHPVSANKAPTIERERGSK